MASASNYLENKLLDHITGKTAYTKPTVYLALCTADPTDAGTGASMNEVPDAGAYARVATSGATWNAASGGSTTNAAAITFTKATGSWGTITHFVLIDSGTHGAGNVIAHGALDASKAVISGDTVEFAIDSIDITLA